MGERFQVNTAHGVDLKDEENTNKMEFSAPEFGKLMYLINGFTMPVEEDWKVALVIYGHQMPPYRLYFNYRVNEEDIFIYEKIGKMGAKHSLPTLTIGGPYPIAHLLEWAQNTLHKMGEYING